jgi:tripartite-type tricarboxylate transporter receptor subunit TctC
LTDWARTAGESRLSALPQVPTFTEAGLPGLDVRLWYGVLAPAGTPKPIVDLLSGEIRKVLIAPDVRENLSSQGMDPFICTPEVFAALLKADMAKYAKIIKTANIKLEN